MVGNVGAWSVEPVVNPSLREGKRQRLIRMVKQQIAGRTGPVRQVRCRVVALELLAAHVAAAEAARRDWESAHQAAAKNDKYLDLVARTAADQHATVEIAGLAEQAAQAAQALRETLQRATLAAEALALPAAR
jgi:hypothetical protein